MSQATSVMAGATYEPLPTPPLRRRWRLARAALIVPVIAFFVICFLYPVVVMMLKGFTDVPTGAGPLANFAWFFGDETNMRIFFKTVSTAAWVTVSCVLVAYPMAYAMSVANGTWRLVILGVVLLPFWTSIVVRNFAWVIILQDRGALNYVLDGIGLPPLSLLGTSTAVTLGMTQVLLPFVVLPVYSSIRAIDPNLMRAALVLGARPVTAFMTVFLPLSLPGVFAGALLVFVLALGFYITPAMLGSPREAMLSQLIFTQIDQLLDWGRGSAMATSLLVTTVAVLALGSLLTRSSRRSS
jgi:putative spermidine/putrescine transport system permease protein